MKNIIVVSIYDSGYTFSARLGGRKNYTFENECYNAYLDDFTTGVIKYLKKNYPNYIYVICENGKIGILNEKRVEK